MRSRTRHAADDELSEVVRRRLQALLAEIPPRRAVEPVAFEVPAPVEPREPEPDPATAATVDESSETQNLQADGDVSQRWPGGLAPRARQFVREHLVVIGIIVLTGCLWGGYSMFQARTSPVAVAASDPSVRVSVATPAPSAVSTVMVHVLGEVRRPGVVTLADGSRVQDAITAAGGLTKRARPGDLNLAAKVTDGAQLVISRTGSTVTASEAAQGTSGAAATIDLNAATLEQLDTLPGVGPVTAQKILAWRDEHGRFRTVAELQEVDGIGPKSYAQIAPRVRV